MKTLLILLTVISLSANASDKCTYTEQEAETDVVYEVHTDTPKHLAGATITITLADGKSSTVPAEKFMVVPRKQKTVVGKNKVVLAIRSCNDDVKKTTVMLEARKDITDIETETIGNNAKTYSKKGIVPGLDVYRRQILDTPVGIGAGVDSNGTLKGMIGLDF